MCLLPSFPPSLLTRLYRTAASTPRSHVRRDFRQKLRDEHSQTSAVLMQVTEANGLRLKSLSKARQELEANRQRAVVRAVLVARTRRKMIERARAVASYRQRINLQEAKLDELRQGIGLSVAARVENLWGWVFFFFF